MRLVTAVVATLFLGCAGWGREWDARLLRPDEDDLEPLTIRCEAVPVAAASVPGLAISVESPPGPMSIGELYDVRRRPADAPYLPVKKRHGLVVDPDAFARTVHGDVERMLSAAPGAGGAAAQRLVVRIVEVRTAAPWPGWTALRRRFTGRVVLGAELRDAGRTVWSKELEGEHEEELHYARISHYESTLGAAYCAALTRLADVVAEHARALPVRPAGGVTGAGQPRSLRPRPPARRRRATGRAR